MAFCVSCGNQVREAAVFCGKCGAPAATPVRAADEKIARADRLVAEETLKKEHSKLLAGLAAGGTLLTFLINIVLMVIGFEIGGVVGGVFLVIVGIAAAAVFVASLIPSQSERFSIASKKAIDPVTGKPFKMLWFVRWMTAMIALWTIVASTDLFNPPAQSASVQAGSAPTVATIPADSPDLAAAPDAPAVAGSNTGSVAVDRTAPNTPAEEAEGLRAFCAIVSEHGADSFSNPEKAIKEVLEADDRVAAELHEPVERANIVVTRVSSAFGTGRYGPSDCNN
jgi:hypothetical protein